MALRPPFETFLNSMAAWAEHATNPELAALAALVAAEQARRGLAAPPAVAPPAPQPPGPAPEAHATGARTGPGSH